jgi:hypothetical protein
MREVVAGRLAQRQADGILRADVDPAVAADVVLGAYEDAGRRLVEMAAKPDFAHWARNILLILYEGLVGRARLPGADRRVTTSRKKP